VILARLLFDAPLPPGLQPTLLILVSPTAVGFSSYVTVSGQVDLFAQSLLMISVFLLVVLSGRLRNLLRCSPFKVGWWAVSFPLAASAIAGMKNDLADPSTGADALAIALLGYASLVIAFLLGRTFWGVARGELKHLST
jgi:tellurite resistance protein